MKNGLVVTISYGKEQWLENDQETLPDKKENTHDKKCYYRNQTHFIIQGRKL